MTTQFHLENFRSYRKASLPLAPLTLLIGANASGKSNALEALRMLSRIAQGQYLQDVFKTLQREGALRGRVSDLTYGDEIAFTLGFSPDAKSTYSDFHMTIRTLDQELVVIDEEMGYEESSFPLYRVEHAPTQPSHQLSIAYNNFAGGQKTSDRV
jgi:predicted ATPase